MSDHRALMDKALQEHFVRPLRERGFTGRAPHLRRRLADRVDYLLIQFYSAGGSFVIELGRTGPDGFTEGPWKDLPVEEIEVPHTSNRRRLTDPGAKRGEQWFRFAPRNYEDPEPVQPQAHYDAVADRALRAFDEQGELWLGRDEPPDTGSAAAQGDGWRPGDPTKLSRVFHALRLTRPPLRVGIVLGGLEPPLWRWEHWRRIVPVMDGLVRLLPRPVSILSSQAYEGTEKKLPFGRMPWGAGGEAGNRKWTTRYLDEDRPVYFADAEFWSPARSVWADEGKDPEMYARLHRDPYGEMQGFILALRRDQLKTPGLAEAADRTLAAIREALPGARQVINDRGWAELKFLGMQSNPLDWPSAEEVFEWGEKRPWSQVASFAAP